MQSLLNSIWLFKKHSLHQSFTEAKFYFSKKTSPLVSTDVFCGVSKVKKRLLWLPGAVPLGLKICARWTGFC